MSPVISPFQQPLVRLVLLALLMLCAASPVSAARRTLSYDFVESEITRYSFETRRSVSTRAERLPAEAERFDHQDVFAELTRVESRLEGTLERFVARRFRDGTVGVVSRVTGLTGTVDRGSGAAEYLYPQLEGKSVSFRLHRSGELLASHGWSHLMGAGRGGDLAADVLMQSLLRLPRHLPGGDGEGTVFTLRIPVDEALERSAHWSLRFEPTAKPEGCAARCWALSYSGSILEDSRDKHPARPMTLKGSGEVRGTLVLVGRGRFKTLVEHQWTLTADRVVRSERDNGSLRGELQQTIETSGLLRLLPGEEQK